MTAKYLYVDAAGNPTESLQSVETYAGANSANRLVETNASGKIDNSLINFQAFDKVFSVRAAASNNLTLTAPGPTIGGVTMANGDKFLAYGQTTASQNGIYVFNGDAVPATRAPDYDEDVEVQAGDLVVVTEGTFAERMYILATNNPIVVGTTALTYSPLGTQLIDAGNGLSYSGTQLNVNLLVNRGLKFIGDDIAIEATDIAGLGLIDDGTDKLAIDFAVTTGGGANLNSSRAVKGSDLIGTGTGQGAKIIGYDNTLTSAYTTATTAQQAIDDAFAYAQAPGVLYTAGTGGVTKGQPVYVSANNTVLPYNNILLQAEVIGIASTTAAPGSPVKVVEAATVLTNLLTTPTLNAKVYWNGTTYVNTIPSTANAYIWMLGRAKNATDLHVRVEFVKRNSP